jgi:uncharacterized DUF497 family protein
MDFEWDEAKHGRNERERHIGFDVAARIFEGDTLERPDARSDYGEERIRAIGAVEGLVLHVIYTRRGQVYRIISARRANRKERLEWQSRE